MGRVVYRKDLASGIPHEQSLLWNGRLNDGMRVEPGIYFVRIITSSGIFNEKAIKN
jgi:hypothetical protein